MGLSQTFLNPFLSLVNLRTCCMCVSVCSVCAIWLSVTPWTVALQAPLAMGFSRQDYWSGLCFLFQGIFLTQGLNPGLPHCRQRFTIWTTRETLHIMGVKLRFNWVMEDKNKWKSFPRGRHRMNSNQSCFWNLSFKYAHDAQHWPLDLPWQFCLKKYS